jgi:hypothetical protein
MELSLLARNPTTLVSLLEAADWTMEVNTSAAATEKLNLSTKVWRALRDANGWYDPGTEGKVDDNVHRVSIAVTTEGKSKAPIIKRPISIAKRPEGYEFGKSNFSRPLVPVSPPESIPASPDGPPPSAKEPHQTGPPSQYPPPPPPPPPSGHVYSAAPASPEPTIGSTASASSGSSKWKELMGKFHKRSPTPATGRESGDGSGSARLARKLSALFGHLPENVARGKLISTPHLESTRRHVAGLVNIPEAYQPMAPAITQPPPPHHLSADPGNFDAHITVADDDDDDDMDEEERRVLGRFGSKRHRDEDDKARRLLGLP